MNRMRVQVTTIIVAVVGAFFVALDSMAALWWMTVIGMALWLLAVYERWRPRRAGRRWR